jgi:SAM-dependent methyltransferase
MVLSLPETPDLFGLILKAQLESQEPVYHVVERDDGFIRTTNTQQYFTRYEEWTANEREIIRHAESPVLDVGVGAGRHALYLQGKGMDVVGLDISPNAISVCKQRGLKKTVLGSACDLPSFKTPFNTFLLFFNNFGICGDPTQTVILLQNLHKLGTPQAKIIISFRDVLGTDRPYHLAYHQRNRKQGLPIGKIRLRFRYLNYLSAWFYLWLPTNQEFRDTVQQAQWKISEDLIDEDLHHVLLTK